MPDDDLAAQRQAYRDAYRQGRESGTLQPGQPPVDPIGRVSPNPPYPMPVPRGGFRKGGKVKRTGVYKLHKGERVLNAKQTRRYAKHSRGNISDA